MSISNKFENISDTQEKRATKEKLKINAVNRGTIGKKVKWKFTDDEKKYKHWGYFCPMLAAGE